MNLDIKLIMHGKKRDMRNVLLYVNDRLIPLSKLGRGGDMRAVVAVDGTAKIEIVKKSPLSAANWFGWTFLYWLMGLFGLFGPRFTKYEENEIFYSAKLREDGAVTFDVFLAANEGSPAVTAVSTVPIEEAGNACAVNRILRRRRRGIKALTVLFWVGAVLGAAAGVLVYLFS